MLQQGQVFKLTSPGSGGDPLWAYRYRTGGRASGRVQRGGFASEQDAGNPPRSPPGPSRFAASTISATPSRPSPFVPASPPSNSPATWAPA
jgi:hypothetical protein